MNAAGRARPVRVCCVSLFASPLFDPSRRAVFGGAELQLYNLATGLARDPRFAVFFVVGDYGQPDVEIRSGVTIRKWYPIAQGARRRGVFRAGAKVGRLIRFVRILRAMDADVYIQRAAGRITFMMAVFCKVFRRKFVYMVAHDADVNEEDALHLGAAEWALFKLGLRAADLVICQHESQANDLKARYGKGSVVRPSAHVIGPPPEMAAKDTVLWVARCEEWKQPERFIELARRFPQWAFVMICQETGDARYFSRVREEAARSANLTFIDYVPFDRIDGFFARAKCLVNTSRVEGFPNTFIQAAKNMAVVLSLRIDPDAILERNAMGVCARGDVGVLAGALERIMTDEEMRVAMARNAYRYAKEHHDLAVILEKDKEMLLNLTGRTGCA